MKYLSAIYDNNFISLFLLLVKKKNYQECISLPFVYIFECSQCVVNGF